jgi:hypothetical protein
MNDLETENYLPIIGFSYIQPICALLEGLEDINPRGPNEVQASPLENGYSACIVVTSVLMLESFIARAQFISKKSPPKKPVSFVQSSYPDSDFPNRIEEIFVVRDTIAHNHIWDTKFEWDDNLQMKLVSAELIEGYGDKKFHNVLDPTRCKTRYLGMNLYPTRICRNDALIVLKTVVDFLKFLEKEDRRFVYISPQPAMYRRQSRQFVEIVESLPLTTNEGT